MSTFGSTLRHARTSAHLSQMRLAEIAGVPQSTVGRIEAGLTVPRLDTWRRLLAICGWSVHAAPDRPPRTSVLLQPDAVPTFMWDSDMTWEQFVQSLQSANPDVRAWAYSRLLSEARWDEIWTVVTPSEVAVNLPLTHFRSKPVWERLCEALARS